ncbi:MAG: hypothetical protein ABIJ56_09385 [Pseudomonadota bacterium]
MTRRIFNMARLALLACSLLPASAFGGEGKKEGKGRYLSVTGTIKMIDLKKDVIVIRQKLKSGERDVTFMLTKKTKVFWSKTKMKVTLKDLNPGIKVIIKFLAGKNKLVASKIVLPGGMKEAAAAILGGKIKVGDKE